MEVPSRERVCVAGAELCDCGGGDRNILWQGCAGDEAVGCYCGEFDYADWGSAKDKEAEIGFVRVASKGG